MKFDHFLKYCPGGKYYNSKKSHEIPTTVEFIYRIDDDLLERNVDIEEVIKYQKLYQKDSDDKGNKLNFPYNRLKQMLEDSYIKTKDVTYQEAFKYVI